jgi:hypothetical protein
VAAEGDLDVRGTLGVARDAPVGFAAIRLRFELDTDASDEELAAPAPAHGALLRRLPDAPVRRRARHVARARQCPMITGRSLPAPISSSSIPFVSGTKRNTNSRDNSAAAV